MSMCASFLVRTQILNETLLHTYSELALFHVYDKCMSSVLFRYLWVGHSSYGHMSTTKLCCTHIRSPLHFMCMTNAWVMSYMDDYEWVISRMHTVSERNFVAHIFCTRIILCMSHVSYRCSWLSHVSYAHIYIYSQRNFVLHIFGTRFISCLWQMRESYRIWMSMNEPYLACTQFQDKTLLFTYF